MASGIIERKKNMKTGFQFEDSNPVAIGKKSQHGGRSVSESHGDYFLKVYSFQRVVLGLKTHKTSW